MSVDKSEQALDYKFSTYGMMTAERILKRYQIKLSLLDLEAAIKSPFSFYHKLLDIPLKNILNGIVLQQANDYQVYAQKLFIDYLLSGEGSKEESSPGVSIREALENERQQLVILGEEYHQKEGEHNQLISQSQSTLMKIAGKFNMALEKSINLVMHLLEKSGNSEEKNKVREAIHYALINCDLTSKKLQGNELIFVEKMNERLKCSLTDDFKKDIITCLSDILDLILQFDEQTSTYLERAEAMTVQVNSIRSQFYDFILRILELIRLLPEYKIDLRQDLMNREALYFDKSIGEL